MFKIYVTFSESLFTEEPEETDFSEPRLKELPATATPFPSSSPSRACIPSLALPAKEMHARALVRG